MSQVEVLCGERKRYRGIDTLSRRSVVIFSPDEVGLEFPPPTPIQVLRRMPIFKAPVDFERENPDYERKGRIEITSNDLEGFGLRNSTRRHFLSAAEKKLEEEDTYLLRPKYQFKVPLIRPQKLVGVLYERKKEVSEVSGGSEGR